MYSWIWSWYKYKQDKFGACVFQLLESMVNITRRTLSSIWARKWCKYWKSGRRLHSALKSGKLDIGKYSVFKHGAEANREVIQCEILHNVVKSGEEELQHIPKLLIDYVPSNVLRKPGVKTRVEEQRGVRVKCLHACVHMTVKFSWESVWE